MIQLSFLKQHKEFDLILRNPPFIRFQHFDEESRSTACSYLREAGYKPTKLANAWAAFVQLTHRSLKFEEAVFTYWLYPLSCMVFRELGKQNRVNWRSPIYSLKP